MDINDFKREAYVLELPHFLDDQPSFGVCIHLLPPHPNGDIRTKLILISADKWFAESVAKLLNEWAQQPKIL